MHEQHARRRLLRMIAAGGLGAGGLSGWMSRALASGDLPATPGINRLEGSVTINGKPARVGAPVAMGDRVATGPDSRAVVVLKGDAFLLRQQTVIVVQGGRDGSLSELAIAAGRVLSVFAKKPVSIKASVASIGIRGTGAYLEVEPKSVYFCLCYGEALIEGAGMESKLVKTTHHEQPLMLRDQGGIMRVEPGPFQNHSDDELILLESLVGREPPFTKDAQYPARKY
jgi:hypothetical protein